jgi:amino acid transporter
MIPRAIFGKINKRFQTPHWNIILIVVIEYILGVSMSLASITNLINYGALGGFLALNVGVIWLYYVKRTGVGPYRMGNPENFRATDVHVLRFLVAPALGVAVIAWVWSSMDKRTLIVGTTWLVIGIIYEVILTKGWRELPPQLEL